MKGLLKLKTHQMNFHLILPRLVSAICEKVALAVHASRELSNIIEELGT